MKKIILFTTLLIYCLSAQAQKETYNWTFGNFGGLTWNTTRSFTVTAIGGGATNTTLTGLPSQFVSSIQTEEGCFSLSDNSGNLMFYSDGVTIWDKTHSIMTNGTGLTGNSSSTQSGIIFPYPGSSSKYVAVTVGRDKTNNLSYSVVDMSSGNGVVLSKNTVFQNASAYTGETVTSFRMPNETDYWVIAVSRSGTSYLNAWKFTAAGAATTPVKSSLGTIALGGSSFGYLKITPDGKHFVMTGFLSRIIVYGDFDVSTGIFTNVKSAPLPESIYGIEFSPDQKLVYISSETKLSVYMADELFLNTNINTVTKKTYTLPTPDPSNAPGALQLGPDQRIYWAGYAQGSCRIIDHPNDFNNPMIYQTSSTFLTGIKNGYAITFLEGLPSFAGSWFNMKPAAKAFACTGYNYKFSTTVDMSGANAPVKLTLNYGDGNTGTITLVAGQSSYDITHSYAVAGTYTVTITPVKADNSTLAPSTVSANAIDCLLRTNRMIRVDLQNTDTQTGQ